MFDRFANKRKFAFANWPLPELSEQIDCNGQLTVARLADHVIERIIDVTGEPKPQVRVCMELLDRLE